MSEILNVLILDDDKNHFEKIREVAIRIITTKQIPHKLVFDYNQNKELIQSFTNYKNDGITSYMNDAYKESLDNLIKKIPDKESTICIVDVNWKASDLDTHNHLGIEFYKSYLLDKKVNLQDSIMTSIIDLDYLKEELAGIKFIPKAQGVTENAFGPLFQNQLCNLILSLPTILLMRKALKNDKSENLENSDV